MTNLLQHVDESRITRHTTSLKDGEIFVFGSNLRTSPKYVAGAAQTALLFGSCDTHALGFCGSTYAIPTKNSKLRTLPVARIQEYVTDFLDAAAAFPDRVFLVTAIGCGLAGLPPAIVAPMFRSAMPMKHVRLPREFWTELLRPGASTKNLGIDVVASLGGPRQEQVDPCCVPVPESGPHYFHPSR